MFPNPQVGAVLVHNDRIIGEGFHAHAGGPHAEVEAVNQVKDPEYLRQATLYVSLEPCNHYGKTPPCTDLILKHQIPAVRVGCQDPNPRVAGRGIQRLRDAGVDVQLAPDPQPFEALNAPFFINQRENRPFVLLKWAQSRDGFIAAVDEAGGKKGVRISGALARRYVHKLRARHHAILVGTTTAAVDNPRLDARFAHGHAPVRMVLDRSARLPSTLHLFDGSLPSIRLTDQEVPPQANVTVHHPVQWEDMGALMRELYEQQGICSVLVEGGAHVLQQFLDQEVYDQVFCLVAPHALGQGVPAPRLPEGFAFEQKDWLGQDRLWMKGTSFMHRHSAQSILPL